MNNFPRDRYNSVEILELFEAAEIQEVQGDCFKSVEVNGEELEIYFPSNNGIVDSKYIEMARSVLSQIERLDNLVQDSCEAEYLKSGLHVRNYMVYLAMIYVEENQVSFRYYGERVNTEWGAVFRDGGNGKWERDNF